MQSFFTKEEYSIEDIQSLIDAHAEESTTLEFKSSGSLCKSDSCKKEIAKDVSAMANSAGGIIVYGISEDNHVASGFSFINRDEYTKEWLEHVINGNIQRNIPDLLIYPIVNPNNPNEVVYLVKIPQSIHSPHQSKDKRFHRRTNFDVKELEEYEIRQLYFKVSSAKLIIDDIVFMQVQLSGMDNYYNFVITVSVRNIGGAKVSGFKIKLIMPSDLYKYINFDPQLCKSPSYNLFNNVFEYSTFSEEPIYQDEYIESFKLIISVRKTDFSKIAVGSGKIELLFSNGKHVENFSIAGRLAFPLEENSKNLTQPI